MSLDKCFEREVRIAERQLESGEIDIAEYNRQIQELEDDYRHHAESE